MAMAMGTDSTTRLRTLGERKRECSGERDIFNSDFFYFFFLDLLILDLKLRYQNA